MKNNKMKPIAILSVLVILAAHIVLAEGLEITQIDARVDYDESYVYKLEQDQQKTRKNYALVNIANSSSIDVDVLPNSNITFGIKVENSLKELDLSDVIIKITIADINGAGDLDQESADFDLDSGDENRADIKFNIPTDADSGAHVVRILTEGEDSNGTLHQTELKLKLDIKKLSHDLRISKVLLSPSIVECSRKTKLTAEIINAGSNAENEVALEFKSPSLAVNSFDKDIFLQSSDEATEEERTHTKTLSIEVPSFFKAGTYPIFVNLYWKNFILFDQKTAELTVKECVSAVKKPEEEKKEKKKEEVQEKKEEKEAVTIIQPKKETIERTPELIIATEEISIFSSPLLLLMFSGAIFILIFAVLIITVYLKTSF